MKDIIKSINQKNISSTLLIEVANKYEKELVKYLKTKEF